MLNNCHIWLFLCLIICQTLNGTRLTILSDGEFVYFTGAWATEDIPPGDRRLEPRFSLEDVVLTGGDLGYLIFNQDTDSDYVGRVTESGMVFYFCLPGDCGPDGKFKPYLNDGHEKSDTISYGLLSDLLLPKQNTSGNGTDAAVVIMGMSFPNLYEVKKTGFYGLVLCPTLTSAPLEAYSAIWRVQFPYGYLLYSNYPLHTYFGYFAIFYFIIIVLWVAATHFLSGFQNALKVQHYILAVAGVTFVEMLVRYLGYKFSNDYDDVSGVYILFTVILEAFRITLSLYLLLIVSLGYGIVQEGVTVETSKLNFLTYVQFAFCVIDSAASVYLDHRVNRILLFLASIPVSVTYALFFLWIIQSLMETTRQLADSGQTEKLKMYENMTRALIGVFTLTFLTAFVISTFVFVRSGTLMWYQQNWKSLWFWKLGWSVPLYTMGFLVVAWIWRPRRDNRSYMLQQLAGNEGADDDPFSYEMSGVTTQRNEKPSMVLFENLQGDLGDRSSSTRKGVNKDEEAVMSRRSSPTRSVSGRGEENDGLVDMNLTAIER